MRPDLHRDVLDRLRSFEFKEESGYLRRGKCPQCAKRSAWTSKEHPWVIRCDRLNRCGWEGHVKELFPDIFESWSDRFKQSETDPNAAADAYLHHARGLKVTGLRGAYTQEEYWNPGLREGTATVRFAILGGSWWERFIDRPRRFGAMKARFAPGRAYGGQWWSHPDDGDAGLAASDEIWITEGIFDALSLRQASVAAAAELSSGNYPEHALARIRAKVEETGGDRPKLIFALDSDRAGRAGIRKQVERARKDGWTATAAQIAQPARGKVDWNDLHLRGRLTPKDLDEYRWRGALLLAASPTEKALLLHQRFDRSTFPFDHDNRLWWANVSAEAVEAALERLRKESPELDPAEARSKAVKQALRVSQIANCLPRPLYFQIDPLTDESWYYYRIDFPHDGPATKTTFTAAQIAAPAEFKKRLLSSAPLANYTGNGAQLDRLLESQRDRLRVVEAVSFVGYSREHRAYVFNDLAVKDGRVAELNDDDYFDLAPTALKTLDRSVSLDVTPWPDRPDFAWIDHLYLAYGPKGLVALAYWFGSLFAEQLRERQKSWPFLELSGEAQSGKSTLIEFLWKLCGRLGYEGFDPAKASLSGRSRTFSQVGNLPVVLMESDRDDDTPRSKKFDLDELKPFYNGRSIRTSGVRTGGNETREPAFRAAVVIEQNATVSASDAMMQRIVRLEFDGAGYNSTTKRAAEALEVTPLDDVSGFILAAVRAEARVLARIEAAYPRFEGGLMENRLVAHRRLAKNHGQSARLPRRPPGSRADRARPARRGRGSHPQHGGRAQGGDRR